jgi:hypothetical protein
LDLKIAEEKQQRELRQVKDVNDNLARQVEELQRKL